MTNIKINNVGMNLDIDLLNKLYNLYLMLFIGYIILLLGSVFYAIGVYKLIVRDFDVRENLIK